MIPGASRENPTDSAHSRHCSGRRTNGHRRAARRGGIVIPVDDAQLAAGGQYAVRLPQQCVWALRMEDVEQHHISDAHIRQPGAIGNEVPHVSSDIAEFGGLHFLFSYSLLLPSLWVCTLSFILSDRQSIYASQVESRSRSPAHQGAFIREVLAEVCVSEFLLPPQVLVTLRAHDPLPTVIDRLSSVPFSVLPVVDGDNRLVGMVNLEEVHLASQEPTLQPLILAADLMRSDIRPLTPSDTLDRALELFIENDLLALPVVNDLEQRRVIGIVRRFEIASAYLRHIHGPAKSVS